MIANEVPVAAALPGYELGAELGRTVFGLALTAQHRKLDRRVAVEIVSAGHTEATGFAAEAHPHAVRVYDHVRHPYVDADDLHLSGLQSGGIGD
jgi:hypothetical protein